MLGFFSPLSFYRSVLQLSEVITQEKKSLFTTLGIEHQPNEFQ